MMRRSTALLGTMISMAMAGGALARLPAAITLTGAHVHPESVTIAADGTAYAGSMNGGVQRISLATGKVDQFIKPGADGTASTYGVFADPVNKLLWVCSNYSPIAKIAGAVPGTFLKGFDLRTGAVKRSFQLPGEKAFCNDAAVAKDGTLYVTETGASHIYRLKPGAAALEDWHHDAAYASDKGSGLDGIAIGSDGNLYVNNYQTNIFARVAVQSDGTPGQVTVLKTPRPLASPDGLRAIDGMRFVQAESNGKVAIVTVDGDDAALETLAEGLTQPTGVDYRAGTVWYVEALFSYLYDPAKKGQTPPPFKLTPLPVPSAAAPAHH